MYWADSDSSRILIQVLCNFYGANEQFSLGNCTSQFLNLKNRPSIRMKLYMGLSLSTLPLSLPQTNNVTQTNPRSSISVTCGECQVKAQGGRPACLPLASSLPEVVVGRIPGLVSGYEWHFLESAAQTRPPLEVVLWSNGEEPHEARDRGREA